MRFTGSGVPPSTGVSASAADLGASPLGGGVSSSNIKKTPGIGAANPMRRPNNSTPAGPVAKKPKPGSLKDVSFVEASKYGSLNEFAFFDKVCLDFLLMRPRISKRGSVRPSVSRFFQIAEIDNSDKSNTCKSDKSDKSLSAILS